MKTRCLIMWLCLLCCSVQAQEKSDSASVACYYDAASKEIVTKVRNHSGNVLCLLQAFQMPMGVGTQLLVESKVEAVPRSYALGRFVNGKYEFYQKYYVIPPDEELVFRNPCTDFQAGDTLTVTVLLHGYFCPYNSYHYRHRFTVQL